MFRGSTHPRRWVPAGLLIAAAVAGLLAALLSGLADGAPNSPTRSRATATIEVPLTTGPLRTALPDVSAPGPGDRLPAIAPARPGRDARVVARVADPYGGPPWAVRTFAARTQRFSDKRAPRRVAQTCAQVGRIVDGEFVWINPHQKRASAVPVDTTGTTVCTGRNRAAVVGALRLPAAAQPSLNPQISATVVWGLSREPRMQVGLRSPDDTLALPALRDGVRLRVVRGDLDIGRRTVIADGDPVEYGVGNAEYGITSFDRERRGGQSGGITAGLRPAAVVSNPSSDLPALLVATRDPASGIDCYAILDRLVGGEPVRAVGTTGALAPAQALCQTAFSVPAGRWTALNGGASSNSQDRLAERRRLREHRTLAGSSSQAWAFPRDVAEVDIEDPLGLRTVRTIPLGDVSIVYAQRAGDIPAATFGSFFDGDERRVFTGRKRDGTTVSMKYWRPR